MAKRQDPLDGPAGSPGSAVVVIPTYNERDNLGPIVDRLLTALPQVHVLVVDDGSPDGTGEVADRLAAADERVHVMHRTQKAGLGAAYVAGFEWALQRDYEAVIEMDADGSHSPEELPRLFAVLAAGADVVIGSRYVPGGRVVNWPWHREALSRGANLYSKLALGLSINDITAGYRVYRREVLEKLDLRGVESAGYCFQVDLTWRAVKAGCTVVEAPITFIEREVGESKMSGSVVREALLRVTEWGVRRRGGQALDLLRRTLR
ncbi:dolichol-phosphate mannosyltransferase [Saccharopolyspora erythraea NRRL 2338]|uniref:Dolichyl-phosphate beta-D-mannosyltransferase n=2 Tax=Saccharopolyspora erythraea TaxID=1836 RepID=A4FC18_SACEN|nr:polyprenol monophosphomannose synthase [Saccharopolyspora erythraea]EQD84636.1 dolichol-phosphate mannosyltransferase [Saccharopolyspora erythraea D]PFG95363.1 dolichol-phosphate mannosyltransferase [Saccharopolyspora erythraea NRRL 2338]QRK92006.1 polyprenol monophosphomannose synthase [Saccharopolyspora erythraea]CAM01593.1 dolichyl-phosphate beta-D-mannosyltransferase [Saccharopolyspora erythraea NRRL 2338]